MIKRTKIKYKLGYHSLLSTAHQSILMLAAESEQLDHIESAIKQVMLEAPDKFHTDESLETRVFYDEPMDNTYSVKRAGFIRARPARIL